VPRTVPLSGWEWPENSLLGRLRDRPRASLMQLGIPVSYQPRQRIIRQGEDDRYALVLLSGHVKVVVSTEFGRDVVVALRGPGELLGEMALLEDRPRSASVIACVPVTAKIIKGVEFVEFVERNAEVCQAIARIVSERLRAADRRNVDFAVCPAPARVARVLIEIAECYGGRTVNGWDLGIPLTQYEIASLAGTGLSTVEKTFHAMQRRDLLRRHYRRIVLTDITKLRQFGDLAGENPY
jgi:CRP-like cAMP-binding protein